MTEEPPDWMPLAVEGHQLSHKKVTTLEKYHRDVISEAVRSATMTQAWPMLTARKMQKMTKDIATPKPMNFE